MKRLLIGLFCFLIPLFGCEPGKPVPPEEKTAAHICSMCSMNADASETEFAVDIEGEDPNFKDKEAYFCCLGCLLKFQLKLQAKAVNIRVKDYPSGEWLPVETASYLVESKLMPKGSMLPFVIAFAADTEAHEFRKNYGGRVLNFEEASAYVKATWGKWQQEKE